LLVLYSSSSYLIVNESKFLTSAQGMAHVLLINGDIRAETVTVSLKDGANIERYRSILIAERSRSGGGNTLAHNVAAALFVTPTNYTISSTAGNATVQTNLMGGRIYIVIVSGRTITVLESN
jgi:hydroxymethylpyrimidine/phosphomethylpyrimidine kinase